MSQADFRPVSPEVPMATGPQDVDFLLQNSVENTEQGGLESLTLGNASLLEFNLATQLSKNIDLPALGFASDESLLLYYGFTNANGANPEFNPDGGGLTGTEAQDVVAAGLGGMLVGNAISMDVNSVDMLTAVEERKGQDSWIETLLLGSRVVNT